ncbi:Transcription initiation factor TFIID subunit 4b [Zea mays]|jgi:hypothetical protein|uniref:Transcription initiation factor TFIID subunit 4b n=1 Tax=Zea mays TaxID=4577 RepID=A0A1D6KM83_MAIZE|nr:Transcription initiation factor TFIID subunit 4b [Zea mays]
MVYTSLSIYICIRILPYAYRPRFLAVDCMADASTRAGAGSTASWLGLPLVGEAQGFHYLFPIYIPTTFKKAKWALGDSMPPLAPSPARNNCCLYLNSCPRSLPQHPHAQQPTSIPSSPGVCDRIRTTVAAHPLPRRVGTTRSPPSLGCEVARVPDPGKQWPMQFFGGSSLTSIVQEATQPLVAPPFQQWPPTGAVLPLPGSTASVTNPPSPPIPGASDIVAADEVCTIFMDLPIDVKETEMHNLLCWLLGFEAFEMNFKGNQPMGFALFSTVHQAITAKAMFQVCFNACCGDEM